MKSKSSAILAPLFLLFLLFSLSSLISFSTSSEQSLFRCSFINASEFGSCSDFSSDIAFYGSGDVLTGELINTKVGIGPVVPGGGAYTHGLCCRSDFPEVGIDFFVRNSCAENDEFPFAYLESEFSSRVSLEKTSQYNYSICLKASEKVGGEQFGDLDIKVDRIATGFTAAGYDCMYRFGSGYSTVNSSLVINGKISSCDAEYFDLSSFNKYPFGVFARLVQNLDSLVCGQNCVSELDNRIYSVCSQQIKSCQNVPIVCDGSLEGAWVPYDSQREVRCQAPFDEFRQLTLSSSNLDVETVPEACENVITKKYNVLLNRETITMNIYVCSDDEES